MCQIPLFIYTHIILHSSSGCRRGAGGSVGHKSLGGREVDGSAPWWCPLNLSAPLRRQGVRARTTTSTAPPQHARVTRRELWLAVIILRPSSVPSSGASEDPQCPSSPWAMRIDAHSSWLLRVKVTCQGDMLILYSALSNLRSSQGRPAGPRAKNSSRL